MKMTLDARYKMPKLNIYHAAWTITLRLGCFDQQIKFCVDGEIVGENMIDTIIIWRNAKSRPSQNTGAAVQ